jgi:hypothetical protein
MIVFQSTRPMVHERSRDPNLQTMSQPQSALLLSYVTKSTRLLPEGIHIRLRDGKLYPLPYLEHLCLRQDL